MLSMAFAAAPARAQEPPDSLRGLLRQIAFTLGSEQEASSLVALGGIEVSTAPLGTSTGGFTFTFDPILRTYTRSAPTFGPSFAQRSLTTGRGKASVGFNWLHTRYDALAGQDLRNGEFRPAKNVVSTFVPYSYTALTLNVSSDTVVAFGQVGVTDTIDIGVAVPWIRISLDADGGFYTASGTNLRSVAITPTTASGVGDVAVFGKYLFLRQQDGGVAASVEVRLPTGDKNALRGLDVTRTLVSLIWSQGGRVSPHANVGYEVWSDGIPISANADVYARNQVKFAAGVEIDANPRLTAVVDLVGRTLRNGGKLEYQTFTSPGGSVDALVGQPGGITTFSLAPGAKWNVWKNVLVTGSVLASLSNEGLRSKFIPVFGIDWAF
jgi:hypothetical protein